MKLVSALVTLYAVLLALVGGALLFVPVWVGGMIGEGAGGALALQLLGAACLGFSAAGWVARRAVLGGIYGRAVVAGNQAFSLIGTLVLLGNVPAEPGVGFWVLLVLLGSGAVLFGWLLLRGPGTNGSRS